MVNSVRTARRQRPRHAGCDGAAHPGLNTRRPRILRGHRATQAAVSRYNLASLGTMPPSTKGLNSNSCSRLRPPNLGRRILSSTCPGPFPATPSAAGGQSFPGSEIKTIQVKIKPYLLKRHQKSDLGHDENDQTGESRLKG